MKQGSHMKELYIPRFPYASEGKLCDGSSRVDSEMNDPVTWYLIFQRQELWIQATRTATCILKSSDGRDFLVVKMTSCDSPSIELATLQVQPMTSVITINSY